VSNELINICYEGESGENHIRSLSVDGIRYVSLKDTFMGINRENREIDPSYIPKSMAGLLKTQLEVLENDEYTEIIVPAKVAKFDGETELFVNEPGLYRVLSSDRSMAGKKFQKWLFHKVIPALTKYGVFPAPEEPKDKGSELTQMAELLAQNARMLADNIKKTEEIKLEVAEVKSDVSEVKQDVSLVKEKLENIESKDSSNLIKTVSDRLSDLNMRLEDGLVTDVIAWCENISFTNKRQTIDCPIRSRNNVRFCIDVIDEAIRLVHETHRIEIDL
jgi:prophage antirepressor-like protein